MQIPPLTHVSHDLPIEPHSGKPATGAADDVAKVSSQFEGILLRQFLGESMKPMLGEGEGSQFYGYLLTDALAQSLSAGGGLGFSSVLQAQLGKEAL